MKLNPWCFLANPFTSHIAAVTCKTWRIIWNNARTAISAKKGKSWLNLTSDTKEQLDHTGIKDDGRPILFAYVFWMANIFILNLIWDFG